MLTVTVILIVIVFIVLSGNSYAYFEQSVEGSCVSLEVGSLTYTSQTEITLGKKEKLEYKLIIKSNDKTASKYQVYYTTDTSLSNVTIGYSVNSLDMPSGAIEAKGEKAITLVLQNNSSSNVKITVGVKGGLSNNSVEDIILEDDEYRITDEIDDSVYTENILNGTDPVLTDNLIPVLIADDGEVTKADISKEWYSYTNQEWANAVVLTDTTIGYNDGDVIPEDNIESYFVWIPRYKYKIFNLGNYSSLTSLTNAVQTIEIEFETKDITPVVGIAVGNWHSHPAFQAFDTNGFWVGKFETSGGNTNTYNPDVLRIKPNVSSWRNITVGVAFQNSYNYMRNEESHMMKNTEWGAVAYLQHSAYGSRQSVRVNNNSSYLTGYAAVSEPTCGYNSGTSTSCNLVGTSTSVTLSYNTSTGYLASTTNNISGVYDMSGGAHEYVMGYNEKSSTVGGSSGLTTIYGNFFASADWEKYYDKYQSTVDTGFSNRILGDATGEMGPFGNVTDPDGSARHRTSWYGDYSYFVTTATPWFHRGGLWSLGVEAGAFDFHVNTGGALVGVSFRVVLTP